MVVLVHENHDKWPNVTAVHHFNKGFDYSNLVSSFCGPNIYQKFNSIRFNYVFIFEYEHLKRFIWQKNHIFAHERNIKNRANFPVIRRTVGDRCLL